MSRLLLFLLLLFILCSCHNSNKYPFAIEDFRKELQPHLIKMVEKGIVMSSNDALQNMASDEELYRLGRSEHPLLRSSAFREMLKRKSINHLNIIMEHLDDTALVFTDAGEFGIWDRTVSDDILMRAVWKTQADKNKTVGEVLSRHNNLSAAYVILKQLKPQEQYYRFIKDMATRPRRLDPDEGMELGFKEIEYALYGLAKFRKKEDLRIIKDKMMKHTWELSETSFELLKNFPDTTYFDVLQAYHHRKFYSFSGHRPGGFSGYHTDRAAPEDFIQAVVVQQSDKSAKLLDTMLLHLQLETCMPDRENIRNEVIKEIWEHPCPAYAALRQKLKSKAKEILKGQIAIYLGNQVNQEDTAKKNVYWIE